MREYVDSFGIFGEPVEFKGLKLYPVLTKDAYAFADAIQIFDIDKNKMGTPEIIQMSYLKFLLNLIQIDDAVRESFIWIAKNIFNLSFNDDMYIKSFPKDSLLFRDGDDEIKVFILNGWEIAFEVKGRKVSMYIKDIKITSTDFDTLRKLVLYQNLSKYDDSPMSDDIKKVVSKYYELKNKGIRQPSLEDKMLVIISSSSETRETIKNMPLKQFEKLFEIIHDKTEYVTNKPLIPHLKDANIEHWIYKKSKNKFDGIFSDANSVGKADIG